MVPMRGKLHDALRAANAPEDKAREAAEDVAPAARRARASGPTSRN